jgi:cell division protein FtsB
MVDLYGYLSMAVATLQQQQAEIRTLKAEVQALKQRRH